MNAILERDRRHGITRKGGREDLDPVLVGLGQIITRGDFRMAAEAYESLSGEAKTQEK